MNALRRTNIILLLVTSVALSWLYSYAMQGPGIDREVFRYAGMTIANGGTPYITFFDHKPPLIYFIYLLAHPFGVYGPQIVFTILTFLVSLLVYQCCRKWLKRYALLLTILWIAMMHDPLVMADGGQSRQFSALIVTALIAYAAIKLNRISWLLVGLGASLVFFTQVTDLPALAPFIILLLVQKDDRRLPLWKKLCLLATGFLIPAILLLLWFNSRGAIPAFFYHAFTFNSRWYIDTGLFSSKITYVAVLLIKTGYLLPLILLPLLYKTRYRSYAGVIFLCGCIQAVALIPGPFFNHYFISCIPFAFFGWVILVKYASTQSFSLKWKTAKWLPALLLVVMLYSLKPWHWATKKINTTERQMVAQLTPYAHAVKNQRGQLFELDVTPALSLNASYNIISPSRWLYIHFWLLQGWDTTLQLFKTEVLQPLDSFRCRYVLDRETDIFLWRPDIKTIWLQYLEKNYRTVLEQKNNKGRILYRLLERKTS